MDKNDPRVQLGNLMVDAIMAASPFKNKAELKLASIEQINEIEAKFQTDDPEDVAVRHYLRAFRELQEAMFVIDDAMESGTQINRLISTPVLEAYTIISHKSGALGRVRDVIYNLRRR